jgi:hypothetical protein
MPLAPPYLDVAEMRFFCAIRESFGEAGFPAPSVLGFGCVAGSVGPRAALSEAGLGLHSVRSISLPRFAGRLERADFGTTAPDSWGGL